MLSPSRKLYHFSLFLLVRSRARISLFLLLNPERGFFFSILSLSPDDFFLAQCQPWAPSFRSALVHCVCLRPPRFFLPRCHFCLRPFFSVSPVLFFFLTTFAPSYSLVLTPSLLVYSCNRYTFFLFLPRFTDWPLSISVFLALILRSNFALRNNSRSRIIACSKYYITHFILITNAKT